MTPEGFPLANTVFAKDQPEYLPLPAFVDPTGIVVSCWRLSIRERLRMLWTGRIWLQQMTFNRTLQPLCPTVECPVRKLTPREVSDGIKKAAEAPYGLCSNCHRPLCEHHLCLSCIRPEPAGSGE